MNSPWHREIIAIFRKEMRSEWRNPTASYTGLMLSITTVFTLAFAFYGRTLEGDASAGLLWTAVLFCGVHTLARSFVAEDEHGTGDLLRMWARPHSVFWGKFAFALIQMLVTATVVALLFLLLTGIGIAIPGMLILGLVCGSVALSATVTLTSAVISRGNNRGTLSGVIALPLLIPVVALGVTAGRSAFEGLGIPNGWAACYGMFFYGAVILAIAPYLFAAIWREP